MKTEQNATRISKGSTLPFGVTSRNAVILGIALALLLCLGAWGAHAADPRPENPNTPLMATSVDEAVVAVVADHAFVTVDGQVVTGTGFKAPLGKQLAFDVDAEDGFAVSGVTVADIDGAAIGVSQDGSTYTIAADDVVDGLTITVETTAEGDRVNAGLFEDVDDADDADQPVVSADQHAPITVAVADVEFTYDGEAHMPVLVALDETGAVLQDYFVLGAAPSVTDVTDGPVSLAPTNATILDSEGNDVTANFDITYQQGNVTVVPATITIVTPSDTKVYDGQALTAPDIQLSVPGIEELIPVLESIKATGTQTEIGRSDNTYTIDWGSVNRANYRVEETIGTLEVTANEAPIIITALDATRAYDGTALVGTEFDLAAPSGYRAEVVLEGSQTNVGSSACTIASYVLFDEQGNDVTETFSDIQTVAGKLTVEPAIISVTTPGDTKVYDGKPLTARADEWITGFVAGETATATITGSQTKVGSSANTYKIVWDGTAKEANYRIVDTLGTLEVTAAPAVTVTTTPQQTAQAAQTTQTTQAPVSDVATPAVAATVTEVEEIIYETVYVEEPVQEYVVVEETPNVVYETQSAPAATAAQEEAAEPASPLQAVTNVIDDVVDAVSSVTTGANNDNAQATQPQEEVLEDDATPLAGVEKVDAPPIAPWIILGLVLLAVIGVLLAVLFGKVGKKGQANKA